MKISVSVLDCQDRVESVIQLNRTNVSYIHIDVMDGKFVPKIQFQSVREIREIDIVSKYPLDIHLMMDDPYSYIEQLCDMNISFLTVHLEIQQDIHKIIQKIHDMGYKAGISIRPGTDIKVLEAYLGEIDLVLVMSVEPGQGGQEFLSITTSKVNELRKMIEMNHYHVQIEVDGGINDKTISMIENADIAVVGSYIVKSDNYYDRIKRLLNKEGC